MSDRRSLAWITEAVQTCFPQGEDLPDTAPELEAMHVDRPTEDETRLVLEYDQLVGG